MKKLILTAAVAVLLFFIWDTASYRLGFYIDFEPDKPVTTFVTTNKEEILLDQGNGMEPFTVRGVNLGSGIPGEWATDYAIDEETYLRWFAMIQEMGANTIRVYTILNDEFYNAFYEYNKDNDDPLWLIHGVWINDYTQNSHRDAYDEDFQETFIRDCRTVVDLLHGKKKLSLGRGTGSGSYRKDVSQWVIGYILGVEWEDVTVAYTNHKYEGLKPYKGEYLSASEEASPFESMLAEVGDKMIAYESSKYKEQRLIAFSNWPTTDPFQYPEQVTVYFMKCGYVDVSHIVKEDAFISDQFVSYHVYPYYPDYLGYLLDENGKVNQEMIDKKTLKFSTLEEGVPWDEVMEGSVEEALYDEDGNVNSYAAYLKMLTAYHDMPVVISEFGVSTGRGMAQRDRYTGRNQGNMSEEEQGEALLSCWEDIMDAGCAGGCVFTWQDEWFKRTWNTMHAVDLTKTPYWSDYQTNEQYFGLLSFDPGEEESVCYVDGDKKEWKDEDLVTESDGLRLSMKYDEKFLYLLIEKEDYDPNRDILYLPVDTTQKSGSTYCRQEDVSFTRAADFLIVLDGEKNSRVLVQERYNTLRAMYYQETDQEDAYQDPPDKDSPDFQPIELVLQTAMLLIESDLQGGTEPYEERAETYETGILRHGNGNPQSEDFDSLTDFCINGDVIEVRLPWQLLNFANPSEMEIHDDYYEHYGVEYQQIDQLYIGAAAQSGTESVEGRINMESFALEGWGKKVTYHERLKESYYILKDCWTAAEKEQKKRSDRKEGGKKN